VPKHHVSIGIYSPARRAAISAGLRLRSPDDSGGRPRWGYENGTLNETALAVIEARKHGATFREIEARFGCSKSTANRLCRRPEA